MFKCFSTANPKTILIYGDSNTWGYDPECSTKSPTGRFNYNDRWTTICQNILGPEYRVVVEALNGRTTIYSDHNASEGEYDCNGRLTLPAIIHSHKPIDMVIIALGANDLHEKFQNSPHDIIGGIKILIKDIRKMTDIGNYIPPPNESNTPPQGAACATKVKKVLTPPKLMIIGPPILQPKPLNRIWGFPGDIDIKSRKLNGLISIICKEAQISFANISTMTKVSEIDGVHLRLDDQVIVGEYIAQKIKESFYIPQ